MEKYHIKIIDKQTNFLVVYKPAGLIVHSGPGVKERSLSDILVSEFNELKNVGEDKNRPGILHRLDKEVAGLLLIARNNESFLFYKNKFKERQINKEYTALIHGKIEKDYDTINFPIARSKKTGKMAAIPIIKNHKNKLSNRDVGNINSLLSAKDAETKFTVIKRYVNYSLLKIKISTGRTHQIRVHLGAYGHPIVGDNIYGGKKYKDKNNKLNFNRVFLEANYLSFSDENNNSYEYNLELPNNLQDFLNNLK
jgi:23S rRNA pseudouridine1911/1915/1917 synthase